MASPWDTALRLLGQRAHSRHELVTKLERRKFEPEEIAEVIQRLDQAGLIDDAEFARSYAKSAFDRGKSERSVRMLLGQRGVSEETITQVLEERGDGESDFDRALRVGRERWRTMGDVQSDTAQRRLAGFLGRRGFGQSITYAVVRKLVDES